MFQQAFCACKCCGKKLGSMFFGFDSAVHSREEIADICRKQNICPGCKATLTPTETEDAVMVWLQIGPKKQTRVSPERHRASCRKLAKQITVINRRARNRA